MRLKARKTVFITRKLANFWFLSLLKLTLLPLYCHLLLLLKASLVVKLLVAVNKKLTVKLVRKLVNLKGNLARKNKAASPNRRKLEAKVLKVEEAKNCHSHLLRHSPNNLRVLVKKHLLRKKIQELFIQ
nr:MAG TPA: hypothetical protein [Caudoviricetes sp.]